MISKIEISGTPPNLTVKVDGVPLPIASADLHIDCKSLPELTVDVFGFDVDLLTEADIHVDEHTALMLTALGWLPPTHECI